MDGLLIPAGVKEIGAIGLVVLAVIMFYTGRIVAGRTVDRLVQTEREGRLRAEAVADQWRTAHETSDRANAVLLDQNRELIIVARTADHVIKSLHSAAGTGEGLGGGDAG